MTQIERVVYHAQSFAPETHIGFKMFEEGHIKAKSTEIFSFKTKTTMK